MAQVQRQMSSHANLDDVTFRDMYQGIEKDSMAYKLLASMGWKEGEGLGANKQGISVHVKAKKKFDTAGVGLKESSARAQDWTLEMCKFSGILKGLQEVVNTAAAAADPCEDDPVTRPKKSKKRKKSSTVDADDVDQKVEVARKPPKTSAAAPDAHSAASIKLSAHAARYAKRARNKLVKGYSQTDLAAILGQAAPTGADMPIVAEVSKQEEEAEAPREAETAQRPLATLPTRAVEGAPVAMGTSTSSKPREVPAAEAEQGWWNSLFARGTRMGAAGSGWDEEKAFRKKNGFSEQDQTDLYNSAQDGKTQGKQGLGVGSRPGQVKKRAWKGKKMTFESDGEEEGNADPVDPAETVSPPEEESIDPDSDMLPGGAVIVWAHGVRPDWFMQNKSQLQTSPSGKNGVEQSVVGRSYASDLIASSPVGSIKLTDKQQQKCLRVAGKMLQKCSGGVKLAAAVDKALASLRLDPDADLQRLRKKVRSVLKKGDAWSVDGGMILPAACA